MGTIAEPVALVPASSAASNDVPETTKVTRELFVSESIEPGHMDSILSTDDEQEILADKTCGQNKSTN